VKNKTFKKDKVNIITLGCSKNLVDSEVFSGQLQANAIDVVHESKKRDHNIVVVNTCGFIDKAKEESVNTINADYKKDLLGERLLATPFHYAYLKISEGCNRTCAFCAIPLMRGNHVSKTIEEVVTEAKVLVRRGVKEILLIAQELTYYGLDIYKKRALSDLLKHLSDVEGLHWIRLHYAYPSKFPLEILDVMKERDNICNYLDMPLQHASDKMLLAMRRQITQAEMRDLTAEIRSRVPGICLRTTLIAGFPGETRDDVEDLKAFLEEQRFDRVGIFTYSHEENTPGHVLEDDVPADEKEARAQEIMEVQQEISYEKNQEKIGQTLKVLIDKKKPAVILPARSLIVWRWIMKW